METLAVKQVVVTALQATVLKPHQTQPSIDFAAQAPNLRSRFHQPYNQFHQP